MSEVRRTVPPIPGSRWRLLARDPKGDIAIENQGIFDELVVDDWLHIEQMDEVSWWIRLGDARISVRITRQHSPEIEIERDVYSGPGVDGAG